MKNKIKNIIFDLGGVLLNIDYDAPVREFAKLGINNFSELYSQAEQKKLFDDFETGDISPHAFRESIRTLSGSSIADSQIDFAWNSILLDFPKSRVEMLRELKKKYKLVLLSNTNEIHIKEFEKQLEVDFGTNIISDLFTSVHYSSRLRMRKPHVETFLHVMKINGLFSEETVFIDDSLQHIDGAKKAGIQAYWLNVKKENIEESLHKII